MAKQFKKFKKSACGSCYFQSVNPKNVPGKTGTVNVRLAFEDALKLKAGVDECVSRLNKLNRSSAHAKKSRLELIIHFKKKRVRINER